MSQLRRVAPSSAPIVILYSSLNLSAQQVTHAAAAQQKCEQLLILHCLRICSPNKSPKSPAIANFKSRRIPNWTLFGYSWAKVLLNSKEFLVRRNVCRNNWLFWQAAQQSTDTNAVIPSLVGSKLKTQNSKLTFIQARCFLLTSDLNFSAQPDPKVRRGNNDLQGRFGCCKLFLIWCINQNDTEQIVKLFRQRKNTEALIKKIYWIF